MGRHSSREQAAFLRSLAGWVLPWVLVAAVAVTAVAVGISALSQPALEAEPPREREVPAATDDDDPPSPDGTTDTTDDPSDAEEPGDADEQGGAGKRGEGGRKKRQRERPELITEGVTVQVLNGAPSPTAGDAMTRRLRRLGFEIVAAGAAARPYDRTVVFWSSSASRPAARALARRFGWQASPKPANLSPSVAVHVVVGRDEA
jgi:hypothetical protein